MKKIIVICNAGERGKTETVRQLASLITCKYSIDKDVLGNLVSIPKKGDFRLTIKIEDKIVGFLSQGDLNTGLERGLDELADKYKCDLIICTCRTKGGGTGCC